MKKLICTIASALLTLHFANAARPAPAEDAAKAKEVVKAKDAAKPNSDAATATPAAPAAPLEVKNKSSFAMDESGRNPFWPIGWKPANKVSTTTAEHTGPEITPAVFLVSSITVDQGGRFAIINGKVMSEGQVFGLQVGNQTYQLTVKAIQDGQVLLQRRDEEIVVPLHRR